MIQAVEKAGVVDREKIRDALRRADVQVPVGDIKFGENGYAVMAGIPTQIQDGKIVAIGPKARCRAASRIRRHLAVGDPTSPARRTAMPSRFSCRSCRRGGARLDLCTRRFWLSLVYGVVRILNFSHGTVLVASAMAASVLFSAYAFNPL